MSKSVCQKIFVWVECEKVAYVITKANSNNKLQLRAKKILIQQRTVNGKFRPQRSHNSLNGAWLWMILHIYDITYICMYVCASKCQQALHELHANFRSHFSMLLLITQFLYAFIIFFSWWEKISVSTVVVVVFNKHQTRGETAINHADNYVGELINKIFECSHVGKRRAFCCCFCSFSLSSADRTFTTGENGWKDAYFTMLLQLRRYQSEGEFWI